MTDIRNAGWRGLPDELPRTRSSHAGIDPVIWKIGAEFAAAGTRGCGSAVSGRLGPRCPFAFLSYAIAWALILPFIPNVFDLIHADETPAELDISIVPVFAMFAPLAAALAMRLFVSKEGLRGSLGPLRKWRFYGLALVLPAVLVSLTIGITVVTGWGNFTWDESVPLPLEYVVLAIVALTYGSVLTFGEEYGWRGYLLPKLLPLGEVKAAVIVGLIWGPWHAPMLAAGLNYSSVNPLAAIGIFIITATALSLLLSRAYLAAGGALLVPVIMHASFNRFGDTLTTTDHLSGDPCS
jgi:CAAX protease family protein